MISETEKMNLHRPSAMRKFFSFLRHSFLWVLGGVIVLWLSSFLFIASIAKEKIGDLCNGAVYVQSGRFKLFGGVQLKGVVIAKDTPSLADEPIFQADEIEVKFEPWQLLRGKFQVHSIFLKDFLLTADYNVENKQWNFQQLSSRRSSTDQSKIPLVTVRNGTVQVRRMIAGQVKPITTIGLNGQIAAKTGTREYSFRLEADDRFGFQGSLLEGLLKIGDDSEKGRLSMQGRIGMPNTTVFDNAWNLEDIRFECEFDKRQVALKRCDFSMGSGHINIRGAFRETSENHPELNLDVKLKRIKLSDHTEPDAVVYSEPILKLLDSGLRNFLTRYHPTGVGDVELSIQGQLDDFSATEVNGTIVCHDISILNETFPYQIDHLTGQIELSGRNLQLKKLAGRHGDVELMIDGHIQNMGPNAEIDLHMISPNMRFDKDLYRALNESVKKVWFSFSPSGRAGLDYHFQRFANGEKDTTLKLELKKAGLVYDQFPYPLENLTGTIIYEPDHVQFDNLMSHYDDDRKVTLNGQVLELRSKQPNFRIHVEAERIPVDDQLVDAMPVGQRTFFDRLEIDALADMDVDIFRNETGKRLLDFIAKIQIDGKRLVYDGFPLPMTDVHLAADITHESVQLHRFEGMTDGGKVEMSGRFMPTGADTDRPNICLDLDLKQFDLNEAFWEVVEPDADRILRTLRMQGRVNVSGHLAINLTEASCATTDLVIQCSENPVLWAGETLAQATGQLHLVDDKVLFEQFSLLDISLESLPRDFFSDATRELYSTLSPSGKVGITLHDGFIQMGEGGLRTMDVTGGLDLQEFACGHKEAVQQLYGQLDAHLEADFKTGQCRVLAKYDIDHFLMRNYHVTDLQGQLVYDPNTAHFESKQFVANLFDGKVIGDFEVDLSIADKANYKLGLSLSEASVKELLAAEYEQSLENVMEGLASGTLSLEGDLKQLSESRGKVTVHVQNMKLGKQSLMGQILTAMKLRTPKEFVFNEIQAEAYVRGPELIIESARMAGDPLVFRGTGKLNLATQQIEMDLVAFDRFMGKEDTIIDRLARGIGSALWKIEVRGDFNNPKIETVYLSVLKQPLNIFRKKKKE